MGLLDMFTGEDRGLLGLALMQASQPRAGGPAGIGEGLLGAINMIQQRKAAQEDREMRKQMQQAQIGEIQAQAQQRAAAAQQAQAQQAQRAAFLRALQGGATTPQQALAGGGGPTQANAAQIGQQQGPDFRALALQFPEQAEMLQKLAGAQDWGRPEVARTEETMQDGRPVRQQFDKFGRPVGGALPQWKAPIQADTGGAVNFLDPVSLARLQSLSKTMTPDGQASNAVARANLGIAQERLAMDKANGGGRDKAPAGYRWTANGGLEAIPGGPADIKAGEAGAKAARAREAQAAQANSVLDTVNEARQLVGPLTAGGGSVLARIPASGARDLQSKLETIKANLGFDRLQQMREASPTGGALGQVAVQELTALQSTVASLDQAQSQGQLKAALDKIETHYGNWLKTIGAERKSPRLSPISVDFGDLPSGGAAAPGKVVNFGDLR